MQARWIFVSRTPQRRPSAATRIVLLGIARRQTDPSAPLRQRPRLESSQKWSQGPRRAIQPDQRSRRKEQPCRATPEARRSSARIDESIPRRKPSLAAHRPSSRTQQRLAAAVISWRRFSSLIEKYKRQPERCGDSGTKFFLNTPAN